jgi:colanic acid/amylovoran biosynthesis glycosyltransferase
MGSAASATVYVVAINPRDLDTSFIRPHLERLPAHTVAIHGYLPAVGSHPVLSTGVVPRIVRRISRVVRRRPWDEEIVRGYLDAFMDRPAAVLAEFGPTAVRLVEPCRRAGLPLIAHFHGYDTSVRAVIDEHRDGYRRVFDEAAAIIAVSRAMRTALIDMGAPPQKVHHCPYGVDCSVFTPGAVAQSPPTAVAVGRFVDKKAPHLTILAFAEVYRRNPAARLRMIGDGGLLGSCVDLVSALRLDEAVTFLGHQPHHVIAAEMRAARCFVQHSVQAWNGDSEGTPNTILEAGASGLPVVSTRHAGIPDVVIERLTGWLVNERDVGGMADAIDRLLGDAALAQRMGRAARRHIEESYAIERRLAHLWSIIEGAIAGRPPRHAPPAESRRPLALDSTPH